MAKVAVTDTKLKDVADAIRSKTGTTDKMTLDTMPDVIGSIPSVTNNAKLASPHVMNENSFYVDIRNTIEECDLDGWTLPESRTSLNEYFSFCKALKSVRLNDWDTSNIINMERMFQYCSSLVDLDLSSFNTSNVTTMGHMFYGCTSLKSVDLSSFNTSNVISMRSMFSSCSSLVDLDLSSFNTSNVTNMSNVFSNVSISGTLDISSWDVSNVKSFWYMFYNAYKIYNIEWPPVWDMGKVDSNSYSDRLTLECRLTRESILQFFNALVDATGEDYTGQKSIQISSTTYNSLSADDLKIATDKGYTITR